MAQQLTLAELIDSLLPHGITLILRNPQGTMELKGADLHLKEHGNWITVHQGNPEDSERTSHLHLRTKGYQYAHVIEPEDHSPQLAFWPQEDDMTDAKPPMAIIFPSFYDWSDGKKEIPENWKFFEKWVTQYGRQFNFL